MNIVKWNENVEPELTSTDKHQLFVSLLKGNISKTWNGTICRKDRISYDMLPPFVQLRKQLGPAQVLIQYGIKRRVRHRPLPPSTPVLIMSMNGQAILTEDDHLEMGLAISEARGVYNAIQDKNN